MKPVHNIKFLSAAAYFLLAAATGLSAEKTAPFPFFKDIVIPEHASDISAFTIDADIYRETGVIPNGIRIVGPDGEFRPFIVSEEKQLDRAWPVESNYSATVTGFETLPDGSVRISASMNPAGIPDSAEPQVVGLRIQTAAKDFDKKVKVYDASGRNLIAEGAFLDYSSRVNLRNDSVRFPAPVKEFSFVIVMDNYTEIKDSPLFRVTEGDTNIVEQEKFRESPKISGISLQIVQKRRSLYPVSAPTPVEILSREEKGKTTVVSFSNGFAPLDSITVDCSDAFFSRPYRLYNETGKLVASGTVRKLETASFSTSASARVISISETRSRTWKLELDHGENDELKDISLQASGPVHQVRFLSMNPAASATGETSPSGYRVYYGAVGQAMPPSDFTDVLRSREEPVLSGAAVSAQQENPVFDASGPVVRNWGMVYKIMMGAAAFAVLLILLFSVKKIDKVND